MTDLLNQLMLQVDSEVSTQRSTKQLDYLVLRRLRFHVH